jgi:hypothetical protein
MSTIINGTSNAITFPDGTIQNSANNNFAGPAFSASFVGTQSVTSNSITKVTLNTKQFDTANAFDATTNYRFTPLVAGYYQFSYVVSGNANAGTCTANNALLYKNGSELIAQYATSSGIYPVSVNTIASSGAILTYMNGSTDYVELYGKVIGTSPFINTAYLTGVLIRIS